MKQILTGKEKGCFQNGTFSPLKRYKEKGESEGMVSLNSPNMGHVVSQLKKIAGGWAKQATPDRQLDLSLKVQALGQRISLKVQALGQWISSL